jgi:hypothetical protein
LALLAGDAVHNLRSSLDHAITQLAGDFASRDSQFPLAESEREFKNDRNRLLTGVPRAASDVVEAVQPYHVGDLVKGGGSLSDPKDPRFTNAALMLIGRLDNRDKHRMLLAGFGLAPWRQPKFSGVKSAKGTYPGPWVRMTDGAELYRITDWETLPGINQVDIVEGPAYTLAYGDPDLDLMGLWRDRMKVSTTKAELAMYADHVEGLLARLEAAVPN